MTKMNTEELKNSVKAFPKAPGVYLMKGARGEVLYIGKASDLRSRVNSYFSKEAASRYQIQFLMNRVRAIETVLTESAKEALLLENTLIKKHRPRYNVHLKDDKSYVSLKLSLQDEAPRLYVTRRIRKDGGLYFGPYASAGACREVVDFIQRHFKLRTCSDHDYRNRVRPCLQYQIKRCDAPCVGLIDLNEYREMVRQVRLFLEGKSRELMKIAQGEMKQAAAAEQYEEAARYRDLLTDMERTLERQRVVSHGGEERDVIGFYREGKSFLFYVMLIREGKLQDHRHFVFKSLEEEGELFSNFLTQYYGPGRNIPREILLSHATSEPDALGEILRERAGHKVNLAVPLRGDKLSLVELANQNAREAWERHAQREKDQQSQLEELQRHLHLQNLPRRLECYDISNFQGKESMGSMVAFMEGRPERKFYRHFTIKEVQGANDFASLYEVLARRFRRLAKEGDAGRDAPWGKPDLVVIDGGKGQLGAAAQALRDAGVTGVDLISLAKSRLKDSPLVDMKERERSEERVFLQGRKGPVHFPKNSSGLFLLVKARDEAHRFGIESHRKLRKRRTLYSALEEIPGVGKVRRQKLLKYFGSMKRLKEAAPKEIAKVIRVKEELAKKIHESL